MCTLRKISGRHLTDFGVSLIVDQQSGPHPLHLFCSHVPERRSEVSRVLAKPHPEERLPRIQKPQKGAIAFIYAALWL